MELSIFLAKAWGILLLVASVSLLNRKNFKNLMKVMKNWGILYVSGYLSLIVGILSVLSHNIWTSDWRVIITIFGWLALLKGVVRLIWPDEFRLRVSKLKQGSFMTSMLAVTFILGIYLFFIGFTS